MFAVRAVLVFGLCACAHADDKKPDAPKTFEMRFKAAKWEDVLEWYAKESGLTMITTVKPKGTFTFEPPKPNQRYTVAEITDILNEALVSQKYLLIRRTMTFFIHHADEKLEPRLVTVKELADTTSAEVVQTILSLPAGLEGTEAEAELKRLLTPFGSLVLLKKANAVLITDTAGNARRIKAVLDEFTKK